MLGKYWEEGMFLELWANLLKINPETSKSSIQELLIKQLETIENNDLKRLFVLVSDEYLINLLGASWCKFLLEIHFFNTCSGGKTFFDNIDYFISTQNLSMLKLYILAIKFGFKGNKENPIIEYGDVILRFFPYTEPLIVNVPYQTNRREIYQNNLIYIIIPFIFIYCFTTVWEFTAIKIISGELAKIITKILQEGV